MSVTTEITSSNQGDNVVVTVESKVTTSTPNSLVTEFDVTQPGGSYVFKSLRISGSSTPIEELRDEQKLEFRYRVEGEGPKEFIAALTLTCSGGGATASANSTDGVDSDSASTELTCGS